MNNEYGMAPLQERLLLIMDDIDRVCRRHGIQYTISDGTLIGAVRHAGFIPWDDDMDIRMMRSEFDRFVKIYQIEKNERFVIGHPCSLAAYSVIDPDYDIPGMVKIEGTINHPWVTIFPMDHIPKNRYISFIRTTCIRFLSGMMGKPPQYPFFPEKSKRLWDIASSLGKLFGPNNAKRLFDRLSTSLNKKDTGYCTSYSLNSRGVYTRYPCDLFSEVEDMVFEDRIYSGIKQYDAYLTMVYGDYMTPIPPEKRNPKHIDLERTDVDRL